MINITVLYYYVNVSSIGLEFPEKKNLCRINVILSILFLYYFSTQSPTTRFHIFRISKREMPRLKNSRHLWSFFYSSSERYRSSASSFFRIHEIHNRIQKYINLNSQNETKMILTLGNGGICVIGH